MKTLKELIDASGLNQQRVSESAGYTPGTVSKHCNGKRGITAEAAIRYASALGIPPAELRPDLDWPPVSTTTSPQIQP